MIGIGSIVGAGFFLGTGISIHLAGPAIVLIYLFGGLLSFFVFSALAEMSVNDPQPGSFRTYAGKAFGRRIGFVSGWMYWLAGVLIMSSEITALAIFTKYWFPHVALWVFAIMYSFLGIGINLLGVKNFGQIESFFAVVKLSTLLIFIGTAVLFLFGWISPQESEPGSALTASAAGTWFPHGFRGLWSAMIYVLFSYGGIAVLGVVSNELNNKREIPKAGGVVMVVLTLIYSLSLFCILLLVPWNRINETESPFVSALSAFQIPYLGTIFNTIIISAAFSTMVGALFSITSVMISLAHDGDAPKILGETNRRGVAVKALSLSTAGLAVSIVLSFLLPKTVYAYMTTAAGVLLILNWGIIFASQIKNRHSYKSKHNYLMPGYPYTSYAGIGFILFTIIGASLKTDQRIGVFVSLGIVFVIFLCGLLLIKPARLSGRKDREDWTK